MPLRTHCPSCDAAFTLDDALRGKKVRCKKCESIFTVRPADEDDPGEERPRPSRGVAAGPPPRRPRDEDDEDGRGRRPVRGRRGDDEEDGGPRRGRGRDDEEDRRPVRRPRDEDDEGHRRRPARGRGEDDEGPRNDFKEKGGSALPVILAIVGVLVLLGGGGVGLWWFLSSQGGPVAGLKPEPKPLPAALAADDLARVKKATVQLRADLPGEGISQGTGFLAVEPGLVITNAHVLGMLTPDSLPPKSVKVIINSGGGKDQFEVNGTVLGVDRTNDLAVLRADAAAAPLPPPLEVDTAAGLIETQKMYIFGFPDARLLGQNITVSESSITSLRQKDGGLHQLQLKGGMHPGNSGGPVTDTRGVVVGVSVSIIRGTELSFAIPGDFVRRILSGGVSEQTHGTPYSAGGQTHVPVRLATLDPLNRIREVKVDVWSGPAGDPLPPSEKAPAQRADEGPRQTAVAVARDGGFTADVPLPPLQAGHVYWTQPITAGADGTPRWAASRPVPFDAASVIERKPGLLAFKPPAAPVERTLRISSNKTLSLHGTAEPRSLSAKMDGHALETLTVDTRGLGTGARLTLHRPRFTREMTGRPAVHLPPELANIVNRFSPTYLLGPTNSVKEFGRPTLAGMPLDLREMVEELFDVVCNTYEVTTLPLPGRELKPGDTWPAHVPMLLSTGPPQRQLVRIGGRLVERIIPSRKEARALNITCAYEGSRVIGGHAHGHVRLSGVVNGTGPKAGEVFGKVSGEAVVNLSTGMLTRVKTTITLEMEPEKDIRLLLTDESLVERVEGNTQGIRPPGPVTPPDPGLPAIAKGTAGAVKAIPGDVHAFIELAAKQNQVSEAALLGRAEGRQFREIPPEGAVLLGVQTCEALSGKAKAIHGVRAIYRTRSGEKFGAWHGKAPSGAGEIVTIRARAGYAVSGMSVRHSQAIDGISMAFRKLDNGRLDEKEAYKVGWIGSPAGGTVSSTDGEGVFYVGITGHVNPGGHTCSLGLITVLPPREDLTAIPLDGNLRGAEVAVADLKVTPLKIPAKDLVPSLALSADGKWLYAVERRGMLHKIDTTTYKRTLATDLGGVCWWMEMSKEGLVAALREANEVVVIDPADLKILRRVPVPTLLRVAAVPASGLAVVMAHDRVSVLDVKAGTLSPHKEWRGNEAALSPDGKTAYLAGGQEMHSFSVAPGGLTHIAGSNRLADNSQGLFVSHDGRYVTMPSASGTLDISPRGATAFFRTDDLKKPAFILANGAAARVFGFDHKAPIVYARGGEPQLMYFSHDGMKQGEYRLPGGGETKSFTAHPAGLRVFVLTENALHDVTLPPSAMTPKKAPDPVASDVDLRGPEAGVGDLKVTPIKLPAKDLVPSLAFSADGKWLFAAEQKGVVYRVEAAGWRQKLKAELGTSCSWLAVSKEGLVATMQDANQVWVLDPETLKVRHKIPVMGAWRVVATPASGYAVAACDNKLAVLDLKAGKVTASMDWKAFQIAISPDGKSVYLAGGDQAMHVFAVGPDSIKPAAKSSRLADASTGMAVSPDGAHVCLLSGGGNLDIGKRYATAVFKAGDLGKPAFIMESGAYPRAAGFDAKAPLAYAMNRTKQLMVFTFDGRKQNEYQLQGGRDETKSFTPHPEGRRVLVLTANALHDIRLPAPAGKDGDGGKTPTKTDPPKAPPEGGVEAGADDASLAGTPRDVGGTRVTEIKGQHLARGDMFFSRDGSHLYTLSPFEVHRIDTKLLQRTHLARLGGIASSLSPSEAGLIVTVAKSSEVWVLDPDTLKLRRRISVPRVNHVASSFASRFLYAVTFAGELSVIDASSGDSVRTYKKEDLGGKFISARPALCPAGKSLFVRSGDGILDRFRVEGAKLTPADTAEKKCGQGYVVAISPDGKWVGAECHLRDRGTVKELGAVYTVDDLRRSVKTVACRGAIGVGNEFTVAGGTPGDKSLSVTAHGKEEAVPFNIGVDQIHVILVHPTSHEIFVRGTAGAFRVELGKEGLARLGIATRGG